MLSHRHRASHIAAALATLTLLILSAAYPTSAQGPSGIVIRFAAPADTSPITFTRGPAFLVLVETDPGDSGQADTQEVNLTTAQGDHEVLKAIETGPATGLFVLKVELRATHGYLAMYNELLEIDADDMPGETLDLEAIVYRGDAAQRAHLELRLPTDAALLRHGRAGRGGAVLSEPRIYSLDGRKGAPGFSFGPRACASRR